MAKKPQKLCFLTAGRMDFGLITPLLELQGSFPEFEFQIVSMSAHNAEGFYGDQRDLIAEQGFKTNFALKTLSQDDSAQGIAQTLSKTAQEIGKAYESLSPDLIIIPGDRYEMMACASVAAVIGLPIAHLYGGDVSFGAFDESFRHAITKLSHLHFVTNEDARLRIVQMGENPEHVYNFGAPALNLLENTKFLSRDELSKQLGVAFGAYNILITYHPTTLSEQSADQEINEVLKALKALPQDHHLFFTMPGPDNNGQIIARMIKDFIKSRANAYAFEALGSLRYLSLMKACDMVLGNSSSGFYEAPSFRIPTLNIGDRQKGRMAAKSVFNVPCDHEKIIAGIADAKIKDLTNIVNPYYRPHASLNILKQIASFKNFRPLLHKKFFMR